MLSTFLDVVARQCHLKFYSVAITVGTGDFAFFVIFVGKSFQKALVTIVADELVMRHSDTSTATSQRIILAPIPILTLACKSNRPSFLPFWGIIKLQSRNCRRDYFLPDSTRAAASISAMAGSYF